MAHIHASEDTVDTDKQSDNCHEALSAKYAEFVEAHMDKFRAKCEKIDICLDELLENENFIVLINGYNLNIKKTCSLVYNNSSAETVRNDPRQCLPQDRADIHAVFEGHLTYQIENDKPAWKNVTRCLDKNYGESDTSTYVDKICGLAYNRTQICNASTHKIIRDGFNEQIHHMKCTCKALQSSNETSEISMPILISAVAGGVVLLLVLFALGFMCYRHKKSRKRQKQASTVVYVQAPSSDNYPVYQEILDDKTHDGYKQSPSLNPPTLPSRYTNTSGETHFTVCEDALGYLEPVTASSKLRPTLPLPGHPNPGYGAPPGYIQDDDTNQADTDNSRLEPADDEDKGYDTLGRNKAGGEAPKPGIVPLGPVPAKRTKKDDRMTESQYFELETDGKGRTEC